MSTLIGGVTASIVLLDEAGLLRGSRGGATSSAVTHSGGSSPATPSTSQTPSSQAERSAPVPPQPHAAQATVAAPPARPAVLEQPEFSLHILGVEREAAPTGGTQVKIRYRIVAKARDVWFRPEMSIRLITNGIPHRRSRSTPQYGRVPRESFDEFTSSFDVAEPAQSLQFRLLGRQPGEGETSTLQP